MRKVILMLLAVLLVGAACQKKPVTNTVTQQPTNTQTTNTANTNVASSELVWDLTGNGWAAMGTAPTCPNPFVVTTPVDVAQATSILYPGQSRPDYKPHGGFRFDNLGSNSLPYVSPIDGTVYRGARYLTNGEIQYTFDIIHPCGYMVRVGHLLELTPKFAAIAETFPAATEGDSRTTRVNPAVTVTAGEQIATKVGLSNGGINAFADFGLFDLRQKNTKSLDAAWAAQHSPELDQHAVCWFDYLTAADEATVRSLPAGDPTAGKTSDFCS